MKHSTRYKRENNHGKDSVNDTIDNAISNYGADEQNVGCDVLNR